MRFRIHFEWPDGTEDSILVSGSSIDELREKATAAVVLRNGKNAWSEEVK